MSLNQLRTAPDTLVLPVSAGPRTREYIFSVICKCLSTFHFILPVYHPIQHIIELHFASRQTVAPSMALKKCPSLPFISNREKHQLLIVHSSLDIKSYSDEWFLTTTRFLFPFISVALPIFLIFHNFHFPLFRRLFPKFITK
jgi:hypothetical protein